MKQDICPNCPNHCSKDNLGCGRGRAYFSDLEGESKNTNEVKSMSEQVIMDIRRIGHALHHNRDLDISSITSNLTDEELTRLHELLSKINSNM